MEDQKVVESWEELLGADDTEYTDVTVGHVVVRLGSLSSKEMLAWVADQADEEKKKTNGLVLVAKCLVDKTGKRIGKVDEMLKLRDKQPKTVRRLVDAAVALNEMNVKAKEKNDSSETKPSDSPSVSLETSAV